jgi:hypothetical protein
VIHDDECLVKTSSQGPAEVLDPGVGVKEDDGAVLGAHVPESGGEKGRLGAEAAAAGSPDGTHLQEADTVGTDDTQPVYDVSGVGIEAKHSSTSGSRPDTCLLLDVVAGLCDRNRPGERLGRQSEGRAEIALFVAVHGDH